MGILLTIIFAICAFLLSLIIMIQDEQGDSLGGLFGGGSSTAFGSRSGNILTRVTAILAVVFLTSAFFIGIINKTNKEDELEKVQINQQLESEEESEWTVPLDDSSYIDEDFIPEIIETEGSDSSDNE